MKQYFNHLRESAGLWGIFLAYGHNLHIIGTGHPRKTGKPANDNG